MGKFGLLCHRPDDCEALPFLEVLKDCLSDSIFLHGVLGEARCFLQAFFQVFFGSLTLQIVIEVPKDPKEGWEVISEVIVCLSLRDVYVVSQVGHQRQVLYGVLGYRAHLIVQE